MSQYQFRTKKRPSFLIGIARLIDVCHSLSTPFFKKTNSHYDPIQNDAEALHNDWNTVGNDMRMVMGIQDTIN